MAVEYYDFGPHKIHHSSVFYTSNLSFAFVNLRPAVTGMMMLPHLCSHFSYHHVLLSPIFKVAYYFFNFVFEIN